jgi:hypothetical protein
VGHRGAVADVELGVRERKHVVAGVFRGGNEILAQDPGCAGDRESHRWKGSSNFACGA